MTHTPDTSGASGPHGPAPGASGAPGTTGTHESVPGASGAHATHGTPGTHGPAPGTPGTPGALSTPGPHGITRGTFDGPGTRGSAPGASGASGAPQTPAPHGPEHGTPAPEGGREHGPFPLTEIQRAYLVGRDEGYELGGVSTHAYFEFEGDLDHDRFRAALEAVVARHGMLRAVVDPATGTQRVLKDPGPVPVDHLDLRAASEDERRAGLARVRERMSHAVRPPGTWPLFGVALTRLGEDLTRLHVDFDGLAFDLASWRLVLEDLGAHYRDPAAAPAPPGLDYRTYLEAVAAEPDPALPASRAYWNDRDLPPAPRLPLAEDPAEVGRPRFTAREHLVDAARWADLKSVASSHRIMAAGLCAGAFAEVLAGRCGQTRFTLNVPCSHRARVHPDVDRLVGQFASFLPVEVDWSAPTLAERFRTLQRRIWRDAAHQRAAGPALARRLAERSGRGGAALLPVVFTSGLGTPFPAEPLPGCRRVHSASQTPQVHFDAQVTEEGDALLVNWDTVDEVVGADLVADMFAEHAELLERLADPGEWTRHDPVEGGALGADGHRVLPAGALEEVLLRVWEEALGVRGLGVRDDLASLGSGPAAALTAMEALDTWLPGSGAARHDLLTAADVATLARRLAGAFPPGRLETVARLSLEAAEWVPDDADPAPGAPASPSSPTGDTVPPSGEGS